MEPSSGDTETSSGSKIHSMVTSKSDLDQVKRQNKVEHLNKNKQNSCSVVAMQDLSDLQLIKSPECIDNTYCKITNSNVCSVNVTPVKSSSNCNARETGCHTESIQADSVNERLNTIDLENLDLKELTRLQKEDSILCVVRGWLESGIKPDWNDVSDKCPDVKYLWYRWDSLFLENEVLYRKWEHDDSSLFDLQIVVPNSFKKYILYQLHDSVTVLRKLYKISGKGFSG